MRWEIETWRKLYTRVDARWLALDLSTRGLAGELIKYADDEGFIDLGLDARDVTSSVTSDDVGDAVVRVLAAKSHERDRVERDVARLLESRTNDPAYLVREGSGVRIRNFGPAQKRNGSAARMRNLRAKRREEEKRTDRASQPPSQGDAPSVTRDTSPPPRKVTDPVLVPVPEDPPIPPLGVREPGERIEPSMAIGAYHEGAQVGYRAALGDEAARLPAFRGIWPELEALLLAHCPAGLDEQERLVWLRNIAERYVRTTYAEGKYQAGFRPEKCAQWLTAGCPAAGPPKPTPPGPSPVPAWRMPPPPPRTDLRGRGAA